MVLLLAPLVREGLLGPAPAPGRGGEAECATSDCWCSCVASAWPASTSDQNTSTSGVDAGAEARSNVIQQNCNQVQMSISRTSNRHWQ